MNKLWEGRAKQSVDALADDFNASIGVDCRMAEEDVTGSIAHAGMLTAQGILTKEDGNAIIGGLTEILAELREGTLQIDMGAEDIHTFIEAELTARIGDAGKRLHTARSRNDQVAVDLRLYLAGECDDIDERLCRLIEAIVSQAEDNVDTIVPGYTHLQRAQPIRFAHHLLAYGMMLKRDRARLRDVKRRMMEECPLGSCALAGTTYPTNREMTAQMLGFSGISMNSIDGVSDRDFCVELMSCIALIMMHLSRFSEEIILWSSWEFRYVELADAYTTGSSIMPQKKNSDMAELVRGKTGRVYGDLMGTLTMLKGLPLAYNKDMQEDKESVFDAVDTVKMCLDVFAPMLKTMRVRRDSMKQAVEQGYINATDLADYLTRKGMPFRSAYKLVGALVGECAQKGISLEQVPLEQYRALSDLIEEDVYTAIAAETCIERRISAGGTGRESVRKQIALLKESISGGETGK